MDTKLKIKEESLPDDVAPQNEAEFFHKVVTMRRNSDDILVYDHCDVPVKTEIKSEAPFTRPLIKGIESEAVICSDNWRIDRKAVIAEQTLISDFASQSEELISEDPITKMGKFNSGHEIDNKIEIKEESLWPEIDTSDTCDDVEVKDLTAVKSSRLCTQASSVVTDKSPLIADQVSGRDTSFYPEKNNPEYEDQKSVVTGMPTAEEHVLSQQSVTWSKGEEMYIKPLHLKQKTLIRETKGPYTCKACNKSFPYLSHLKRHNVIHEGKKPHQCKTCDKSFTRSSYLETHYLIHEGKKPHQCKTCDRSFTHLLSLKRHYLIHEGKKPHQCKTCEKSFTQLSDLKKHNLIHEGKKPHQCKTCDKSFTVLSDLKRHYLIHEGKKPHQCKTCDKSFSQLSHLKTHYLIHEGKKPHQCKICDKSFSQLSHLKIHYLTHEGKNPHQCKTCDKSFTRLSNLKRHYLVHKNKK